MKLSFEISYTQLKKISFLQPSHDLQSILHYDLCPPRPQPIFPNYQLRRPFFSTAAHPPYYFTHLPFARFHEKFKTKNKINMRCAMNARYTLKWTILLLYTTKSQTISTDTVNFYVHGKRCEGQRSECHHLLIIQ
jgi:hypothetical protein